MLPLWCAAYPGTTTDVMAIHFSHKRHDLDPTCSGHGRYFHNQTITYQDEYWNPCSALGKQQIRIDALRPIYFPAGHRCPKLDIEVNLYRPRINLIQSLTKRAIDKASVTRYEIDDRETKAYIEIA